MKFPGRLTGLDGLLAYLQVTLCDWLHVAQQGRCFESGVRLHRRRSPGDYTYLVS